MTHDPAGTAWPVDAGRRLFPPGPGPSVGPVHGEPLLPVAGGPGRPYLAIVMVASVDGRVARRGAAAGLGSPTDQRLVRRLRAEADALLYGAGTLRAERFAPRVPDDLARARAARGQPFQPLAVVLTASGRVPAQHPFFWTAAPARPRLVFSEADLGQLVREGVDVVRLAPLDLRHVLGELGRRGVQRIVCEGGPTLSRALLAAGCVDELFLTLAPRLLGGPDPLPLVAGEPLDLPPLALRSLYEREGELFLRYGIRGSTPTDVRKPGP